MLGINLADPKFLSLGPLFSHPGAEKNAKMRENLAMVCFVGLINIFVVIKQSMDANQACLKYILGMV